MRKKFVFRLVCLLAAILFIGAMSKGFNHPNASDDHGVVGGLCLLGFCGCAIYLVVVYIANRNQAH